MKKTANLAILVVRGVDAAPTRTRVEAHRGRVGGEDGNFRIYGFTSPTDAVLAGLTITAAEERAAAGVCLGEVTEERETFGGRPVATARELAGTAARGEVLLVEAVYLAMNRVEVSAAPTNLEPGESIGQRIYRADPQVAATAADSNAGPRTSASAPVAAAAAETVRGSGSVWTHLLPTAFLVGAFLVGTQLSGSSGLGGRANSLAELAEELSTKGQYREAAHAFFRAYEASPGQPVYEARFREALLRAVDGSVKGGRPDAAFHLLLDAQSRDPFRRDLEDRLQEVGLLYLGALMVADSRSAFPREEARLLEALPLREQKLRDQLVGIKAREHMKAWRALRNFRMRSDFYNQKIAPLWEESGEHPELYLVQAEMSMHENRFERMVENLETVLDKRPEWKTERSEELGRVVLDALKSMDRASTRGRYMGRVVDFCVQRLGDGVADAMADRLEVDEVGSRVGAYRFFERREALSAEQIRRFHERNLQGLHAVGENEGPLKDPVLVREAMVWIRSLAGEERRRFLDLLDRAIRSGDMEKKIVEEARSEAARLRLAGGD